MKHAVNDMQPHFLVVSAWQILHFLVVHLKLLEDLLGTPSGSDTVLVCLNKKEQA